MGTAEIKPFALSTLETRTPSCTGAAWPARRGDGLHVLRDDLVGARSAPGARCGVQQGERRTREGPSRTRRAPRVLDERLDVIEKPAAAARRSFTIACNP